MATPRKNRERVLKKGSFLNFYCEKLPEHVIVEAQLQAYKNTIVTGKLLHTLENSVSNWVVQAQCNRKPFIISAHHLKKAIVPDDDLDVDDLLQEALHTSSTTGNIEATATIDTSEDIESDSEEVPIPDAEKPPLNVVSNDVPIVPVRNSGSTIPRTRPSQNLEYDWIPLNEEFFEMPNMFARRVDTQFDWSKIDIEQFGGSAKLFHHECNSNSPKFSPISCFFLAFPVQEVRGIVARTNEKLKEAKKNIRLDISTFFKVLAVPFLICIRNGKPLESHFKKDDWDVDIEDFIKVSHYRTFIKYMSWTEVTTDDKWSPYKPFMEAVNDRRYAIIIPGKMVVIDEAMCKWVPFLMFDDAEDGMPHIQKLPRKPVPVGAEFKVLVDVTTGVILRLEVVKSREDNKMEKFGDTDRATIASVKRLLEPWKHSGLIVIADSFFSSVLTLVTCLAWGLHFIGNIKIGRKNFPSNYFNKLKDTTGPIPKDIPENETRFMKTQVQIGEVIFPFMAACWYSDRKFISSVGNTNIVTHTYSKPYYVTNENGERSKHFRTVPMAEFVKLYYSGFGHVDVHNHRRQGVLAMEKYIQTKSWVFRLICTTLGMILVDAYLIHKYFYRDGDPMSPVPKLLSFRDFVGEVVNSLIKNDFTDEISTRSGSRRSFDSTESAAPQGLSLCVLSSFKTKYYSDTTKRPYCGYCRQYQTTKYCVTCDLLGKGEHPICDPNIRPRCMEIHRERALPINGSKLSFR